MTGLPYAYCSNLSSANTTTSSSFSICAYLDSVSVRAQLAKATAWPFYRSAALQVPSHLHNIGLLAILEAYSTWEVVLWCQFLWFVWKLHHVHGFSSTHFLCRWGFLWAPWLHLVLAWTLLDSLQIHRIFWLLKCCLVSAFLPQLSSCLGLISRLLWGQGVPGRDIQCTWVSASFVPFSLQRF